MAAATDRRVEGAHHQEQEEAAAAARMMIERMSVEPPAAQERGDVFAEYVAEARAIAARTAASRLQRLWRRVFRYRTTARILDEYLREGGGPTVEGVRAISFEALVVRLREKEVIQAARRCLERIHLLAYFRHGNPALTRGAALPANVNVRVFLAAFMIVYRSAHVFESMGDLEQRLLEVATPLLAKFFEILAALRAAPHRTFAEVPAEVTAPFVGLLYEYLRRFKAWKIPDEIKLTTRIQHALIALYQAEEHLPPDEPEDSKLKVEFRTQIERLRSKLQQISGQDALAQFDANRAAGRIVVAPHPGNNNAAAAGAGYAALPGRLTNEQLAHELLLDPTFQLDESGGCSVDNPVFHRIRESFHTAFWDSLVDDLRLARPCFVRVLRVLGEIRDGLADLAGAHEAAALNEAIDLDYLRQRAEEGAMTPDACRALLLAILAIIQRVQSPKRDAETKAKWKELLAQLDAGAAAAGGQAEEEAAMISIERWFCRGLEFLLDRVNAMRIDAANARLRLIAPVIRDHGIDYERGKFQVV